MVGLYKFIHFKRFGVVRDVARTMKGIITGGTRALRKVVLYIYGKFAEGFRPRDPVPWLGSFTIPPFVQDFHRQVTIVLRSTSPVRQRLKQRDRLLITTPIRYPC